MTNRRIAARLLEIIERVEAGQLGPTAVAESLELHEPALEGVPRDTRDRLHRLAVDALRQDLSELEQEQLGVHASREALQALKATLTSIANE